jgi:hypothetical protein
MAQTCRQFGTEREDFDVCGCRAMMLKAINPTSIGDRPWVFCGPVFSGPHPTRPEVNPNLFNHPIDEGSLTGKYAARPDRATHRRLFQRLLESGFFIGGIEVGESMGNPEGRLRYTAFYHEAVRRYELQPKPCLYATSRGALMLYNWAADNPDRVACIGANQPVIDLALFPGLEDAATAFRMGPEEFRKTYRDHNPIDRLPPLAARRIPILHIVGEADELLPLEKQMEFKRRYEALGGEMRIVSHAGVPHGLWPDLLEDMRMYDFFIESARRAP